MAPTSTLHGSRSPRLPSPGPRVVDLACGQQTLDHAPPVVATNHENTAIGKCRGRGTDPGSRQWRLGHPLTMPRVEHLYCVESQRGLVPAAKHVEHVLQRLIEAQEGSNELCAECGCGRHAASDASHGTTPVIQNQLSQGFAGVRVSPLQRLPQHLGWRSATAAVASTWSQLRLLRRIRCLLCRMRALGWRPRWQCGASPVPPAEPTPG
mmetsp:Transcript_120367/g.300268  ORF Transcript_120367/g.300268 Transcript_120367/m.300268 type:complete len:209 (-) Transcript_120367:283-909(-)